MMTKAEIASILSVISIQRKKPTSLEHWIISDSDQCLVLDSMYSKMFLIIIIYFRKGNIPKFARCFIHTNAIGISVVSAGSVC